MLSRTDPAERGLMSWLAEVDWREILVPDTPLLEIVVRGR